MTEYTKCFRDHLSSITLFFLLGCRLIAMIFIPLNDTTEARYAEIARKMLETGDWITPMHDYGVPFWGKPPLSFWLSALSMKLFGVHAFAVRLPSLFLSLGVLWVIYEHAKQWIGKPAALTTTLVLSSSIAFFISSGAVMTDPSLLFCTTLTLIACINALNQQHSPWRFIFFIGLGLGLLSKGPVALVLTGMPIFFWVLLYNQWRELWKNIPWITGTLLMLAIAAPWYILAEMKTPGFLNYFIIGEHIGRFVEHGWQGDKYGFAHKAHYGMILVFALIGIFPWTIGVVIWLKKHMKQLPTLCKSSKGWATYWLLALFLPIIFFSIARNVIWPYVLPSIPAFALIYANFTQQTGLSEEFKKYFQFYASLSGILLLIATSLFIFIPEHVAKSQKYIVDLWLKEHPLRDSKLIYWSNHSRLDFSAAFYSSGRAKITDDPKTLRTWLMSGPQNAVIIDSSIPKALPKDLLPKLTQISSISMKHTYTLYRFNPS